MWNWLKKKMGYHVCEEFTQWQTRQQNFSRPSSYDLDGDAAFKTDTITYTRRWQERQCTICGKMEQRDLKQ